MADQWWTPLDGLNFNEPTYQHVPIRSYHSSDESETGSHGGGGFRPSGHTSGRDFLGNHGRPGPSFSSHDGRLLVDDSPFLPPREPPTPQFIAPAALHYSHSGDAQNYNPAFEDRSQQFYYRQHVEEQWAGPSSPPPPPYYSSDPSYYTGPPSNMPTALPPSAFLSTPTRYPDAGPYLRQQLNLPPNAVVNLWSIPDPASGEKPTIPLPMLIKLAIYGSEKKKLTLQEIYTELAKRFQWFREHQHENAWKNSIRHNLSLNKVFKNMQRPVTEPGKGSYWELDVSGGEGYKRPRKRRSQSERRGTLGMVGEEDLSDEDSYSETDHTEYRPQSRRRSPYAQDPRAPTHPRLRVNTDRSGESSSPPTPGSSRAGAMPTIDPPASQRRPTTSTYRQPGYGQGYGQVPIDPALQVAHGPGTSGPSSYASASHYSAPAGGSSRSGTPVDSRPPPAGGRMLRPRPSLSMTSASSSAGAPLSPTDEAYAKSRRRARG